MEYNNILFSRSPAQRTSTAPALLVFTILLIDRFAYAIAYTNTITLLLHFMIVGVVGVMIPLCFLNPQRVTVYSSVDTFSESVSPQRIGARVGFNKYIFGQLKNVKLQSVAKCIQRWERMTGYKVYTMSNDG